MGFECRVGSFGSLPAIRESGIRGDLLLLIRFCSLFTVAGQVNDIALTLTVAISAKQRWVFLLCPALFACELTSH